MNGKILRSFVIAFCFILGFARHAAAQSASLDRVIAAYNAAAYETAFSGLDRLAADNALFKDLSTPQAKHFLSAARILTLGLKTRDLERLYSSYDAIKPASNDFKAFILYELASRKLTSGEASQVGDAIDLIEKFLNKEISTGYSKLSLSDLITKAKAIKDGKLKAFKAGVLVPENLQVFVKDAEWPQAVGMQVLNGIVFAASEFNASGKGFVSLVVQDTRKDSATAVTAARVLLEEEKVDFVLGPVYSQGAAVVAKLCSDKNIAMLTPTAMDETISQAGRTAFQLNPTYKMRGRFAARYAMSDFNAKNFVVLGEKETYSSQMAEGFRDETTAKGGNIKLFELLPKKFIAVKSLEKITDQSVDAFYVPMTQEEPILITLSQITFYNNSNQPKADKVTKKLTKEEEQAKRRKDAEREPLPSVWEGYHVIGSGDWYDLDMLNRSKTSFNESVFAIDFFLNKESQEFKTFESDYRTFSGREYGRLTLYGYDAMAFVASVISQDAFSKNRFADFIRNAPQFAGLHNDIFFDGLNVNQKMRMVKYTFGNILRVK
jgi:ABC-type branched-subunit amino acid transport system substrate-binding protein